MYWPLEHLRLEPPYFYLFSWISCNSQIPGLNTPLNYEDKIRSPWARSFEIREPDPEFERRIFELRDAFRRKRPPGLHPLERGWSGNFIKVFEENSLKSIKLFYI